MAERSLPAPSAVADMCAQAAWKTPDENTRQILEYGAETIRALMARCVVLARQRETTEPAEPVEDTTPCTVAWEFDIAEGELIAGPDAALAELNTDEAADGVVTFRTLTLPCVTWFGNDRDAVEVRAFAGWLTQMADWLEGTR